MTRAPRGDLLPPCTGASLRPAQSRATTALACPGQGNGLGAVVGKQVVDGLMGHGGSLKPKCRVSIKAQTAVLRVETT